MANQDPLPLPIDIPWQPLCVSNDMIDPTACNKKFPMPWKTSIAISGYEPDESLMPQPFCGGKLTYLKVTVTIAGYQPTDEEIKKGYTTFGNTPVEVALDDIFATYFGCYGVLLNIAVFPNSKKAWNTQDFPRIIAMEPQVRELIQSSTESGEILTHSKDETSTSKSYSSTHSSKTGVSGNVKVNGGTGKVEDKTAGDDLTITTPGMGWEASLGATGSWENASQDKTDTSIDGLRERSERNSTSTNLQQLYNLLSAYHLGTNRGVFLMLPRPHMLQPTDRRTFVQGVRSIEGVQEFFLIVSRPHDMEGICVEAKLDTGHFKEDAEVKEPTVTYKESSIDYVLSERAKNFGKGSTTQLEHIFPPAPPGWYIDRRTSPSTTHPLGDFGHVGISESDNGSNAQGAPKSYNYQAISDTQIKVTGYIEGGGLFGPGAIFNKKYHVYLRSIEPISSKVGNSTDIADMFITSRSICCCFYSGNPCLIKGKITPGPLPPVTDYTYSKITEQRKLTIPESLLSEPIVNNSLEPAVKALLRKLKSIMISTREDRYSHFEGGISFLDTDFFVKSVLEYYPDTVKNTLLSSIKEISRNVTAAYGSKGTINDALSDTLATFIMKTQINYNDAVEQRRLIGLQIKNLQ